MGISFDIIGDIAIFELQEGSKRKPMEIARQIKRTHPSVKTVLQRTGEREGTHRLREMKRIMGKETETMHKEHGFRYLMDPTKVFFSPREATERERIASMTGKGETVMVMFAGVGPFGIVIAGKNPLVSKVYQVEINPAAYEYMKRNISMNKLGHKVVPVLGDVRKACKPYFGECDRVITPLARHAYQYLEVAFSCLGRKGMLHFYAVGRHAKGLDKAKAEKEMFSEPLKQLREAAGKAGRKIRIVSKRKVLPYSPGGWKVCIDAEVSSLRTGSLKRASESVPAGRRKR